MIGKFWNQHSCYLKNSTLPLDFYFYVVASFMILQSSFFALFLCH